MNINNSTSVCEPEINEDSQVVRAQQDGSYSRAEISGRNAFISAHSDPHAGRCEQSPQDACSCIRAKRRRRCETGLTWILNATSHHHVKDENNQ